METGDSSGRRCHSDRMRDDRREDRLGGGIFLAIGPLAGLGLGVVIGQPTIGVIGGVIAGALAATAVWAMTR